MDNEERRAIIQVTDKPIELQSMVQTVFTFLILGVLSWIGITLEAVRDNTFENNKNIALFNRDLGYQNKVINTNTKRISANTKLIVTHIGNRGVHIK